MNNKTEKTINLIEEMYLSDDRPWFVAFSGGKDSTLVLLFLITFLKRNKNIGKKKICVVYCDTGVEIPVMHSYTIDTLKRVQSFSEENNINLEIIISKPTIEDSFFVNVLGKGYVPPSFMFRWCTDRLRTRPLQKATNGEDNIIVLGTRFNESNERDRVLKSNQIDKFTYRQRNYSKSIIFSPIIDYSVEEVWQNIEKLNVDGIIDLKQLKFLYRGFEGNYEKDEEIPGGRYGCWVCTVVRKDKAGINLVKKGYEQVKYLMDFRELLLSYRNDCEKRLPNRKNHVEGKGPFKLYVRKQLLDKLLETQILTKYELITDEEIEAIHALWEKEELW